METGVELDFAINWARSAMAEARSAFEIMPGGGTVEEESGLWAGVPISIRWPSVNTSGLGTWSGSWSWIGESRVSTTSSMEACGRLDSEEWRVQAGSIGVRRPARKEFWVVQGLEVMGIKIRIDVQDWSLKYCYELGMDQGRTEVLYFWRGLGFSLCAAPPDVYCPRISGKGQARVRRFGR